MIKCKDIKGSIDSIESFGLVDGPGIRTVIFLNECHLRCKYCHNPEMWTKKESNMTPLELVTKIKRYKPYYRDNGGVTFSGGEPLLQSDFIIECAKLLKEEKINIAIDTAGVGYGNYDELLDLIDLVILDIKHTDPKEYKLLTGGDIAKCEEFIKAVNNHKKRVWIRQVIIPDFNDNLEYLDSLGVYLKKINNIERIDFLPFHRLGIEKYRTLKIPYPYEDKEDMDKAKCDRLHAAFLNKFKDSL